MSIHTLTREMQIYPQGKQSSTSIEAVIKQVTTYLL